MSHAEPFDDACMHACMRFDDACMHFDDAHMHFDVACVHEAGSMLDLAEAARSP